MEFSIFVSVLIPAFNEEKDIARCLESLINQSYPASFYEVIVMDNGSTDRTKVICERLGVQVIDASSLLIGGVRNLGAKCARGDVFAYIDADCIAPKDWIENGLELLFSREDVGAIGGNCDIRNNANWIEKAWVLDRPKEKTFYRDILATGSFFIQKEVFNAVGGFNPDVMAGEDTEISRKLIKSGKKLIYSTDIRVVHLGFPRTVRQFIRRQVWQSSDYLNTRKGIIDPVFILVHLFTLLFLGFFLFSIFDLFIAIASLLLTIFLALALGGYRYYKSSSKLDCSLFAKVIVLNYLYLFARSIGLINSYMSKTRKII